MNCFVSTFQFLSFSPDTRELPFGSCPLLDKNIPLTDSLIGHLITKSNEWKEEEESRVLMQTPGLHNIRKECLRKIIFGIDTTEEEIKTLKALVKKLDYPNLFFAKCRPSTQTFAVFIEDDPT